jgi:predicted ester cyclase
MTTPETNKNIVRRFNKEFIEQGDMKVFYEIMAPEFINHSAPEGVPKGPEGVLYLFLEILKPAFPDLRVEIYDQVAEGDKVTTRKAFHGTHRGEFMGVPPTYKEVEIEVMDIIRLRDGRFVEHWSVWDLQQLLVDAREPVNEIY